TFPGAEGAFHQSYSLDFLPQMPPARTASDELRDAVKDNTLSAPLRRLFGAWIATRVDYTGRDFGLQMALAYDIKDVLPAARTMLTTKVKDDPYPGNTARNLGFAMLVVGKLGTKDDLPLLERYAKDGTECARFLNDPPPKPGQPHLRLPRPPVEGQDATTQLRDVSVAMRLHLLGQKPDDFGFYWDWPNGPEAGRRNRMGEFYLHAIGFLRAVDREAAHAKAKEWLDKQKKADPPARGAKVWPHFAKVVGNDAGRLALFDRIVADPKNLELLERAADGDPDLAKAYFARRDELYTAARREVPGRPGVVRAVPVPAADAAGWLLLGTYPATKATAPTEVTLTFLHRDPGKAASPLLDLLQERNPESAPLRKLVGAWLANRGDDSTAYADALPLALRHDIPEALPTARRLLKDYAESKGNGGRPFTLSHVRATSLLVIAKYGAKADLPQVEAFLKDDNLASSTVRTTPAGGEPITAQVRDAAAVAAVHLRGGDVRDMGFLWPTKLDGVPVASVFDLSHIGFRDATDREAAHSKAKGWLDKQKGEPKREEPAAGLLRDLADLDDLRRGEQTDFAAVEKRGGELLAKYPAAADRGRIYATLTRLYANSGIGRTFARVTKYGRLALEHENNPVARGQVFSYLASAAEVAVTTADPLADDPLPVKRRRAAEILLEGYRELLPLKLPDAAPELPGVEKIGGLLNGTDPAEEARVRERHAAQVKAREEAAVVRDLVHSR
ncbi:MAG TPA: hypothetical protein VM529_20600, partial [Gemmata sp.]|nr:hypothetical protein [Gemmata sp.]